MKNQKGITLVSLTVYIVITIFVIVMLTVIRGNYQKGLKEITNDSTVESELNQFNLYFLEDTKKEGNNVTVSNDGKTIKFSSGNIYEYDQDKKVLYLNIEQIEVPDPEYQELEYIESTGTQYIDTNTKFIDVGEKIVLDMQLTSKINNKWFCGTNSNFEAGVYDNKLYTGAKFTYSSNNLTDRLDATGINTNAIESNIYIFARNWKGNYDGASMKLYSAKIYDASGNLIKNFIPCYRKVDGVIGIYDIVNGNFYINKGTGTFGKGKEVTNTNIVIKKDKEDNTKIALLKDIENCVFTTDNSTGKTKIKLNVTFNGQIKKEKNYIMSDEKATIAYQDENDYIKTKDIAGLPKEYQKVEYIESTGTQYIDTGYIPSVNTKYYLKLMSTNNSTSYRWFIGSGNRTTYGKTSLLALANNSGNFYHEITGSNVNATTFSINVLYEVEFSVSNLLVNGQNYATNRLTLESTGYPVWIFACNNAGNTYDNRFIGRMYSVKIYEDGELTRDFISCYCTNEMKDVNGNICSIGTIGLYDLVENKFYTNSGTGTFLKGEDV